MKWWLYILIAGAGLLYARDSVAREIAIYGRVYDATDKGPVNSALVSLSLQQVRICSSLTDSGGSFVLKAKAAGTYILEATVPGYLLHRDTIVVSDTMKFLKIYLEPNSNLLNEVQIIEHINSVSQRDDTTEYDARAFKVNSGADAYDLLKKMPGMELSGKNVTSNGEAVTRLVIDGKPFFSNDPYTALKNFPAYVIRSVQVYKEQGEQQQFTGFKDGPGTTTINIVTRPDKRQGQFGKLTAGIGNGDVYALYGNVNLFDSSRRLTAILQSNNNSTQNFSDAGVYESSRGNSGNGVFNISNLALNYWQKWNAKTEMSANVTASRGISKLQQESWRQYILAADSGRQYRESNITDSRSGNYRFDLKISYAIDSYSSLVLQPVFSLLSTGNTATLTAITTESDRPVNRINNSSALNSAIWSLGNDILFKRKFRKAGRTLSLKLSTGIRKNEQTTTLTAMNRSYGATTAEDTMNQQSPSVQSGLDLSANAAYTEPLSKSNSLQIQYKASYEENNTDKRVYDRIMVPPAADSQLSNAFDNRVMKQKAGADYKYRSGKFEFSTGIYGQWSSFYNRISFPVTDKLSYQFRNILPLANLQYRLSTAANLQVNYTTSVATPAASQLQTNLNNTNQLYLQTGNPGLRQTYRHNLNLSFLFTNLQTRNSGNISIGASTVQQYISNEVTIAANDTMIGNTRLYKGGQLSRPVNLEGYRSINAGINLSWPLKALRSNLSVNTGASLTRIPALINGQLNYSLRQNFTTGINLNSNITDYLDYTLISNTSYGYNSNTLNSAYTSTYFSQDASLTVNITIRKHFMIGSDLFYQYSNGISAAAGRNNLLCNMSIAAKLFKSRQGVIRLSFYDILNQNRNIQYIVTDTYISSVRTSALQRYASLSFTWSFNKFNSGRH